jgi:hypothetical protein
MMLAAWVLVFVVPVAFAIEGLCNLVTRCLVAVDQHAKAVSTPVTDDDWRMFDAPEFADETPIYTATIAHVARMAAEGLDAEWAELAGGER